MTKLHEIILKKFVFQILIRGALLKKIFLRVNKNGKLPKFICETSGTYQIQNKEFKYFTIIMCLLIFLRPVIL